MNQVWSGNESENSHTITTTTTGSKCSQKEVNNQTDYQSFNALGPPKEPFFAGSWSWIRSSARHTLSNQQDQVMQPETVNLIENAQRHCQGSLFGCFEYVPYTALIIVCTINVTIDCKKNKVSNPFTRKDILDCKSRQEDAWFVFCFKIKLCAMMMFSLLLRLQRT